MLTRTLLFGLVLLLPVAHAGAEPSPAPAFVVIVNPNNPETHASKRFVAEAFLKKTRYWRGREVIQPVDLPQSSRIRAAFSEQILGRSTSGVKNYWQQLIFSGREMPPPELETEEQVVRFVAHNPGAIGYVSDHAVLTGVNVLTID